MEPTSSTGDLVLAYRGEVKEGDVPAYVHPEGAVVIHRVVEVMPIGYRTQGDNLETVDPWLVTPDDVLGTARVATLAPITGAAASLFVQALPFTHLPFDAADVCTYNVKSPNTCMNGGGPGNGGGNGGQPPGQA